MQMPELNGLSALWDQPNLNTTIYAEISVDQVCLGFACIRVVGVGVMSE